MKTSKLNEQNFSLFLKSIEVSKLFAAYGFAISLLKLHHSWRRGLLIRSCRHIKLVWS